MPPLLSASTACDISEIGSRGHVGDIDMIELPIFDDPLLWEPQKPDNHPLPLNLDDTESFQHFGHASTTHGDALPAIDFGRSNGAPEPPQYHQKKPNTRQEPTGQLENALLLFSEPVLTATLLDETRQPVQFAMTAELGGMFFVAEDIFNDNHIEQPELTCYRRNLWQCLGDVTISRQPKYLIDGQGNEFVISQLMASIVAKDPISGNLTDIVSTSFKTTDPATGDALWATGSPPICPLSFPNEHLYQEPGSPNSISLKMAWKRLQFKHSTANNGRRNGPQQHYVVQIHLLAESELGNCLDIAEIQSSPIVVRGRSPRNFGVQKEIPVSRIQKPDKRSLPDAMAPLEPLRQAATPAIPVQRQAHRHMAETSTSSTEHLQLSDSNYQTSHRSRKNSSTACPPRKRLATSSETPVSSLHGITTSPGSMTNTSAPFYLEQESDVLNLSLFDDDDSAPVEAENDSPVSSAKTAVASSADLDENDDMYYEYFPLSADDWMPSIEAVYCPHKNHYATPYQDTRRMSDQGKSRRYFTIKS